MKISYLDGRRFHRAFIAGAEALVRAQSELNRINVFPVPDGDTGSNLACTVTGTVEDAEILPSLSRTCRSLSEAAISAARGNSGLILAQFLYGFSRETGEADRLPAGAVGTPLVRAVDYARAAVSRPVEGTILTVMRAWAEAVARLQTESSDLVDIISRSLDAAHDALDRTPEQLAVLAEAGVVDAGAKGFVIFIEGITDFIREGSLRGIERIHLPEASTIAIEWEPPDYLDQRYCVEAILISDDLDPGSLRQTLDHWGDAVVVTGHERKAHIHIHTWDPQGLFAELGRTAVFSQPKVDDLFRQVEAVHHPIARTAIVTDSSCDLPPEQLDRYQVYMVPLHLSFGSSLYLDKLTMSPDLFYKRLISSPTHPTTSQPPVGTFAGLYAFLADYYDAIVSIHLSSALSGTFDSARLAAERIDADITVIDSRTLCASLGLIVSEAARLAVEGVDRAGIVSAVEELIPTARIFVAVRDLRHMVRGGRVSPVKGTLARLLNLTPIVTLDADGAGTTFGQAFSRRGVQRTIEREVVQLAHRDGLRRYAVTHADDPVGAQQWAGCLQDLLGRPPEYIMGISPVIGLNAGPGALAVSLLTGGEPAARC